jgi:dTMP kinase
MKLKKGLLIVFEGIDGAGKTTQAKLLQEYLTKRGFDVVCTKEPTDSIYGKKIKKLAKSERLSVKPQDEYNLFINDRRVHVDNLIMPALEKKQIVISDRYYFSTIAYQSAIGLDSQLIRQDNETFAPLPEIVFLLKVPPRLGIRRIQKSRKENPNLFEQEEYLKKVEEVFESLKDEYIVPINGVAKIEEIHGMIVNVSDDILAHYQKKTQQYHLFNNRLKAI